MKMEMWIRILSRPIFQTADSEGGFPCCGICSRKHIQRSTPDTVSRRLEQTEKQEEEPGIPAGMWRKCNKCGKPIYVEDVRENFYVCPKCGGYFRVHAWRRIQMVTDPGTFEEWDREMEVIQPLKLPWI